MKQVWYDFYYTFHSCLLKCDCTFNIKIPKLSVIFKIFNKFIISMAFFVQLKLILDQMLRYFNDVFWQNFPFDVQRHDGKE